MKTITASKARELVDTVFTLSKAEKKQLMCDLQRRARLGYYSMTYEPTGPNHKAALKTYLQALGYQVYSNYRYIEINWKA